MRFMHEQWRRGGESVRVIFKINRNPAPPEEFATLGTEVTDFFHSKYIGHFEDPSVTKVVLPSTSRVERVLDILAHHTRAPWKLSCLLEERETFYYAYWPDYKQMGKAENEKLDPDSLFQDLLTRQYLLEERFSNDACRYERIERQVAEFETLLQKRSTVPPWWNLFRWLLEWLSGTRQLARRTQQHVASLEERLQQLVAKQRRLAVVVDWQNFLKVVQAESPRLPLEQCGLASAVEAARWWRVAWPRELIEVVVVDYASADTVDLHLLWEVLGYTFVRVDPKPGVKKPDDQAVRDAALEMAQRPGLRLQDICLITGDVDFAPLCRRLRDEFRLQVFAAGFIGHVSRRLAGIVPVMLLDHSVPLPPPSFWEEAAREPTVPANSPSPFPSPQSILPDTSMPKH